MNDSVNVVLSALEQHGCKPKRSGRGWKALCPAHPDRNPSLSVASGYDGRCLVYCHAGCSTADVLQALGLTFADLRPAIATPPKYSPKRTQARSSVLPTKTPPKKAAADSPDSPPWLNHPLVRKAAEVFEAVPLRPEFPSTDSRNRRKGKGKGRE